MDLLKEEKVKQSHQIERVEPGSFEHHQHWYPKAHNAMLHPMVQFFLQLDNRLIIDRYCHLHPMVKPGRLKELLQYKPAYYPWSGADLINVTNARGKKQMVVIESNSCPSGQKSMPLVQENAEQGGYRQLMEHSFSPYCKIKKYAKPGTLAVLYDKNLMENGGYASAMADYFQCPVYLVPCFEQEGNPFTRVKGNYLEILTDDREWRKVNAAFRYVTQKPWNRLPMSTKTRIYNPIVACLAGGRNKLVASKAYEAFNHSFKRYGLKIRTPVTIHDVAKDEIPGWVKKLGGQAVIKVPYSNAGQGVYTIVNEAELHAFMLSDQEYTQFIVQSLIGNYKWSSTTSTGKFFHLGTIPNSKGETFVFDLRMMICSTPEGFRPLSVYSRRAEKPLVNELHSGDASWDILGTNLSHKTSTGDWTTDTHRLIMMDRRDFNKLGLGVDDLIEAFIQTVMANIAIDKMAIRLMDGKGRFRRKLFSTLNDDPVLMDQILRQT